MGITLWQYYTNLAADLTTHRSAATGTAAQWMAGRNELYRKYSGNVGAMDVWLETLKPGTAGANAVIGVANPDDDTSEVLEYLSSHNSNDAVLADHLINESELKTALSRIMKYTVTPVGKISARQKIQGKNS